MELASNVIFIKNFEVIAPLFLLSPTTVIAGTRFSKKSNIGKKPVEEEMIFDKKTDLVGSTVVANGSFIPTGSILKISKVSIPSIPKDAMYIIRSSDR